MDLIERDLIVWWCPRCKRQSERMYHFCEKGPPLFPQLDVETRCEEIKLVPADQRRRVVEDLAALRAVLSPDSGFESHGARIKRAREMVTGILADLGGQS
jgi:hypothetical protein